jgi:hypothetical protein
MRAYPTESMGRIPSPIGVQRGINTIARNKGTIRAFRHAKKNVKSLSVLYIGHVDHD